jgi:hypothetical protein
VILLVQHHCVCVCVGQGLSLALDALRVWLTIGGSNNTPGIIACHTTDDRSAQTLL